MRCCRKNKPTRKRRVLALNVDGKFVHSPDGQAQLWRRIVSGDHPAVKNGLAIGIDTKRQRSSFAKLRMQADQTLESIIDLGGQGISKAAVGAQPEVGNQAVELDERGPLRGKQFALPVRQGIDCSLGNLTCMSPQASSSAGARTVSHPASNKSARNIALLPGGGQRCGLGLGDHLETVRAERRDRQTFVTK